MCYLHSAKVLDPPVSVKVDEGIADGQRDSDAWHQVHGGRWQAHVDNVHAEKHQTKVVVVVVLAVVVVIVVLKVGYVSVCFSDLTRKAGTPPSPPSPFPFQTCLGC